MGFFSRRGCRPIPARAVAGALVVALTATTLPAFAQSSPAVAAEALFEEGRKLMGEGKYEEACPKFADSERLDPSSSTLLNLANCYEKSGKSATAWATYREAASRAKSEGREDYLATALKRADALSPKLSKLVIAVKAPVEGLEIKRDGVVVTPSEWGSAIPADPGKHSIEARAPHKQPWSGSTEVPGDAKTATIVVPALADAIEPPPPPPPPPRETETKSSPWKTVGWVVGGAGVVSLGVATIFIARGKSKFDESLSNCSTTTVCGHTGVSLRDDARTDGNIASVFAVVGGAALVTGVALILFSPSKTEVSSSPTNAASVRLVPSLGGASLMGSF